MVDSSDKCTLDFWLLSWYTDGMLALMEVPEPEDHSAPLSWGGNRWNVIVRVVKQC